jgi:hypothetical protein
MTNGRRLTLTPTERGAVMSALATLDTMLNGTLAITADGFAMLAQQRDDLRRLLATAGASEVSRTGGGSDGGESWG